MNNIKKFVFLFLIIILIGNCTEKIAYSGKILNNNEIDYSNVKNLEEIISLMGQPSYIDPIENKYYYFTEQKKMKNFFNQKVVNRNITVFFFDSDYRVTNIKEYGLNNQKEIDYAKAETPNEILEKGFLEKIFGGIRTGTPVMPE